MNVGQQSIHQIQEIINKNPKIIPELNQIISNISRNLNNYQVEPVDHLSYSNNNETIKQPTSNNISIVSSQELSKN